MTRFLISGLYVSLQKECEAAAAAEGDQKWPLETGERAVPGFKPHKSS